MWQIKWLRRLVRQKTKPIQVDRAHLWKQRLSLAYMLLAWNAFGLVCYMMYSGRKDWALYYGLKKRDDELVPPGEQWASALGIERAKVIRYSGFQKLAEYDYQKPEEDASEFSSAESDL